MQLVSLLKVSIPKRPTRKGILSPDHIMYYGITVNIFRCYEEIVATQYSVFLEDTGLKRHVCNVLSNIFSANSKNSFRQRHGANVAEGDPLPTHTCMLEIFHHQMLERKTIL